MYRSTSKLISSLLATQIINGKALDIERIARRGAGERVEQNVASERQKYKRNQHLADIESARRAIKFEVAICDFKAPTA